MCVKNVTQHTFMQSIANKTFLCTHSVIECQDCFSLCAIPSTCYPTKVASVAMLPCFLSSDVSYCRELQPSTIYSSIFLTFLQVDYRSCDCECVLFAFQESDSFPCWNSATPFLRCRSAELYELRRNRNGHRP